MERERGGKSHSQYSIGVERCQGCTWALFTIGAREQAHYRRGLDTAGKSTPSHLSGARADSIDLIVPVLVATAYRKNALPPLNVYHQS